MPIVAPEALNAVEKTEKLAPYLTDLNTNIVDKISSLTDANFDVEFKKLPLIVNYNPRVGGKSRHKNKKNNKSRRRNQSKKQRK